MNVNALFTSDPAAEYLRTYREWRYIYGINDPCIDELRAAIAVESARESLPIEQRDRLEILIRLIEHDRQVHMECAA